MINDNNLGFIKEKIGILRTAVMYSMSESLVKLPNDIITYVSTDDEGHLWFLCHLPSQSLIQCEQVFPARLHFSRKGCDFFVEVSGKASIVSNFNSSDVTASPDIENKKAVLIKMTMSNVEYTESDIKKVKTKFQLLAEKSYRWIIKGLTFNNNHSYRNLQSH